MAQSDNLTPTSPAQDLDQASPPQAPPQAQASDSAPQAPSQERVAAPSADPDEALGPESDDYDIDDSHVTPEAEAKVAAELAKGKTKDIKELSDAAKGETPTEAGKPEEIGNDWKDLNDVQAALTAGKIPEASRPYVQAVLKHADAYQQMVLEATDSLGRSKATFDELAAKLEAAKPGEGVAVMAEQMGRQVAEMDTLSEQLVGVTWSAFYAKHPAYEAAPQKVKDTFASLLESGAIYKMFDGPEHPTLLAKMEAALDYAQFRTGIRLGAPASGGASPSTRAPEAPVSQAAPAPTPAPVSRNKSPTARGAAAINEGGPAPAPLHRSLEDMDVEELMDRYDSRLN